MACPGEPEAAEVPLRVDAERNRQRIMAAARAAFAEHGLDITLDGIAERAGVGVGTVYRRFANKEALIDQLFADSVASVVEAAEEALQAENAWDGLVSFFERRLAMEAEDRGLHQILSRSAYGRDRTARAKQDIAPRVLALVRRAQKQGYLRKDLESRDVPVFWLMLGAATEFTSAVAPGAWRRYLCLILDGLRAHPEGPTPLPAPALTEDQFQQAVDRWGQSAR